MIKQECIGIPDMILLLMIFCFKKIKIKAEIVLSPGGAYFYSMVYPAHRVRSYALLVPPARSYNYWPYKRLDFTTGFPVLVSDLIYCSSTWAETKLWFFAFSCIFRKSFTLKVFYAGLETKTRHRFHIFPTSITSKSRLKS